MQKISWLINNYLLSIFALILGILSFYFYYLFFVFFSLLIFFYPKKFYQIILIAYILGLILATRQTLKENIIAKLAERNSNISASIKNITTANYQKIEVQEIKINEKIDSKFIPNFFYTQNQRLKIGNIVRYKINKNFNFWQNFVSIKKDSRLTNFFSVSNQIKEKFDNAVCQETQKTCNTIFWGYNAKAKIHELYCLDKLGCQHLMARSGLHLTPINAIFFLIKNKISTILGITMLILYALCSASSFSFLRAIIITILFYFWQLLGFKTNKKLIFSQSLIITIILWPQAIFTASFQLSFTLVAALYFLTIKPQESNIGKRLKL
jgi:predicted membrane metal-binding protein